MRFVKPFIHVGQFEISRKVCKPINARCFYARTSFKAVAGGNDHAKKVKLWLQQQLKQSLIVAVLDAVT